MDWNHPPFWFIFIITIVIPLIIIALFMVNAWLKRSKPFIIIEGIKFFVENKTLRTKLNKFKHQIELMIPTFIDGMSSPGYFNKKTLTEHIPLISCYLCHEKLHTENRVEVKEAKISGKVIPEYNGLTLTPYRIDIACDKDFWDEEGQVQIYKTAFLYELLNACIYQLLGYSYAYAEVGMDPNKKAHWNWIEDLNKDGEKDADDMGIAMLERSRFDKRFQLIESGLIKMFELK